MSNIKSQGEYFYGSYEGIAYQIKKRLSTNLDWHKWTWTYYVYLPLSRINESDAGKLWRRGIDNKYGGRSYETWKIKPLQDIDMQGGITWFQKHYTINDDKQIEIGADYEHIWKDREYTLDDIEADAIITIQSILERFPELKEQPSE